MIQVEYPHNNNYNLIKHYSDAGYMILQKETGIEYIEAVDLITTNYTYEETNHLIPIILEGGNDNGNIYSF